MDNDAKMLEAMGDAVTKLQIKYRNSSISDRIIMKPELEKLIHDYTDFQLKLIQEGVITTDADLEEMEDIRREIDNAARTQEIVQAIARTIAFIAKRFI